MQYVTLMYEKEMFDLTATKIGTPITRLKLIQQIVFLHKIC